MNSKAILLIERDRDMSIVFLHFLFDLHVYKLSLLILYFCLHVQAAEKVLSFEQLSLIFRPFDLRMNKVDCFEHIRCCVRGNKP